MPLPVSSEMRSERRRSSGGRRRRPRRLGRRWRRVWYRCRWTRRLRSRAVPPGRGRREQDGQKLRVAIESGHLQLRQPLDETSLSLVPIAKRSNVIRELLHRPVLFGQRSEVAEQANCPLVAGGIPSLDLRFDLAPHAPRPSLRKGIESHTPGLLGDLGLPAPLGLPPFGGRGLTLLADPPRRAREAPQPSEDVPVPLRSPA